MTYQENTNRHSCTIYKSFDCSVMELADDIAYGIHDLEDAIVLRKVHIAQFMDEVVNPIQRSNTRLSGRINTLAIELFSDESYRRKNAIGAIVNNFITAIEINRQKCFKTPLLDYQAVLPEPDKKICYALKALFGNTLFKQPMCKLQNTEDNKLLSNYFKHFSQIQKGYYHKYLPKMA